VIEPVRISCGDRADGQRCSLHRPPNRDLCHVIYRKTVDIQKLQRYNLIEAEGEGFGRK